jgi:hypothetical protein
MMDPSFTFKVPSQYPTTYGASKDAPLPPMGREIINFQKSALITHVYQQHNLKQTG